MRLVVAAAAFICLGGAGCAEQPETAETEVGEAAREGVLEQEAAMEDRESLAEEEEAVMEEGGSAAAE